MLDESQLVGGDELSQPKSAPADAAKSAPAAQGEATLPCDLASYLDEWSATSYCALWTCTRFNRTAAGASLGLSLRQIRYRMARLGITDGEAA